MRNLLQWQRYQLHNFGACPSSSFNFVSHLDSNIPHFFLHSRSYETPERTIYDESGMGYTESHIDSRLECSETQSGGTSCIQMKTEPLGGPSSPESTSETNANPDDCAGCGRSIQVSRATVAPFCQIFIRDFELMRFSMFAFALGSILPFGGREAMACWVPSVLCVQAATRRRSIVLFTWWKYLLQIRLLQVSRTSDIYPIPLLKICTSASISLTRLQRVVRRRKKCFVS